MVGHSRPVIVIILIMVILSCCTLTPMSKTLVLQMERLQKSISANSKDVMSNRKLGEAVKNGNIACLVEKKTCMFQWFMSRCDNEEFIKDYGGFFEAEYQNHEELAAELRDMDTATWTVFNHVEQSALMLSHIGSMDMSYLALVCCRDKV